MKTFLSKQFFVFFCEPYESFHYLIFFNLIFFFVYKVRFSFLSSSSVSFPFLFRRTQHRGVGQRSGTGLETPQLNWALPLKILNQTSLGVVVPVFLHPGGATSLSYFFSCFPIPSPWSPNTYFSYKSISH